MLNLTCTDHIFYMDESGLTGSDLEDKLLQDVLLYNAMILFIHLDMSWDKYSDQ
jgi:hypothetical protein